MTETRLVHRRYAAPLGAALSAALLLFMALAPALPAWAQTPLPTEEVTEQPTPVDTETPATQPDGSDDRSGECYPPSTQEWVMIGVGTLAIFVFCFFLVVRVVQRSFIHRDRSATLGRHFGILLTFLLSSLGMIGLAYLVTGCLHRQFLVWLFFPLTLLVIYGIYTLVIVRSE